MDDEMHQKLDLRSIFSKEVFLAAQLLCIHVSSR